MDLKPGQPIDEIKVDAVFLGSCTNGRIEDLRAAAKVVDGYHVATTVRAMVVPGSQAVKHQAEQEGLDRIFKSAGFEWREPGCSMCLGMNPDILQPGERCASTMQPQLRRPPGPRRPHPPPLPRHGRSRRHHRPLHRHPHLEVQVLTQPQLRTRQLRTENPLCDPSTPSTSTAAPLPLPNIDTDQIIPKQFLKRIERTGYGDFLFYDWRYNHDTPDHVSERNDFVLNKPEYKGAEILLAERNFGCGSSREHAAWAINQYGFRAVIAPSFADIFFSNAGKNGIILVRLTDAEVETLIQRCTANPAHKITINLEAQTVTDDEGFHAHFDIDPFRKHCLLNGLDDIGLTLLHEDKLNAYESQHQKEFWLSPKANIA